MARITGKWIYLNCIECNKKRFLSYAQFIKLTGQQVTQEEVENLEAVFKCKGCREHVDKTPTQED